VRVIDGLIVIVQQVWLFLATPGTRRDAFILGALVSAAATGWYTLYWPALRPRRGAHRA